ncbi:lysozyme inhibitor LprI family protein [Aquitalea denitrificans]|uniref:lysozyme inhibitor LprI family protein n=1 Tax=Aquitalea denitrificans TaxID=519081 RepID=UPI0013598DD7|nr:lysozyme inhibitor LprI family protein [Aquitalea denitrificans]
MQSKIFLTLSLGVFLQYEVSQAAGFDCTKAVTSVEKMICADAYLSKLDSMLNAAFDEAQSETAGYDGDTGQRIDPVGKSQKKWLLTVRNRCQTTTCLESAYKKRIRELKAVVGQ